MDLQSRPRIGWASARRLMKLVQKSLPLRNEKVPEASQLRVTNQS
jgi:hypothetical protein